MSSTHTWSFTRLWAMIVATWFAAAAAAIATGAGGNDGGSAFGMIPLAIGIIPAFLAGSWAGSHREIREWSLIRLVAMWVVCIAAFGAVNDVHGRWLGASLLAAPVAILTIRWLELRREPPISMLPAESRPPTPAPVPTPEMNTPIP